MIDNEEEQPHLQSPLCSPGDPTGPAVPTSGGSGAATPVAEEKQPVDAAGKGKDEKKEDGKEQPKEEGKTESSR